MNNQKILDISWETVFKISIAVIVFYLLFVIRDIFVWFIFALIISVLFNPAIEFLYRKLRIPRIIAVVFIYVGILGVFSLLVYLIAPLFSYEIKEFVKVLPLYFEKISPPLQGLGFSAFADFETFVQSFGSTLEKMANNIMNVLFTFFGGVFTTLFVITTAFFLSAEKSLAERMIFLIFPKRYEVQALAIWGDVRRKVAGWFGARILACLFVGVAAYITFVLFNVKYPFTLALLAGALNFIPYIGAAVTGVLLFLILFPISILKALFVLIAFVLIQQVEGNIVSPILMKKITGLPPALVIVSLVIGGKLWGVLGAILVIPLAGIIFEFTKEFLQKKKEQEAETVK